MPVSPGARRWIARSVVLVWPVVLAAHLARGFFVHPPDVLPATHEQHNYVYRLMEFRDLLAAGYWSPQWATHFRGGLGSPYFGYYQPGFFYLASLVPWCVDATRALGVTVIAAVVFGFATAFTFIRSRFGPWAGLLGATAFVVAPYVGTEVYLRGDLSELTAMMLVPFAMHRFLDALERGRRRDLIGLAVGIAAVIVTHPAVGLLIGLAFGVSLGVLALLRWDGFLAIRLGSAMGVGVGLAAFYALPVAFETDQVSVEAALAGFWSYSRHFAGAIQLLLDPDVQRPFPVSPGRLPTLLLLINVIAYARWGATWEPAQRLFLGFTLLAAGLMFFLMTSGSSVVWDHLPLLWTLQFPGRALAVLTPAMACAIGAVGGTRDADWRHVVLGILTLALVGSSFANARLARPRRFIPVAAAAEIATVEYFRPDLANEWLPRGATVHRLKQVPRNPIAAGSGCLVSDFVREQGRLAVQVSQTPGGCDVTLPHLFFPLGWRVTLNGAEGRAVSDRTAEGLLKIRLPPASGGLLEARFSMTPMRRLGWGITLASATIGFGALWLLARRGEST